MEGLRLLEQVFAEEFENHGDFELYEIQELDGVTDYDEDLSYNSGWYNYYDVTFKYKGKSYTFEYKEHTSDNVSDTEYFYGTFKEVVEDKILEPVELFGGVDTSLTLNKDIFTQEEVIKILKLSPYMIHELLKDVEDSDI
ncbi:hypothetical protein PQE74_gp083 [Bacillus phage vB_BanS_Chewbecca]|uniref:Uncharacterized protein n=1 Tax=Bacillus phage vB_BanS_Chewbecca TaxID=2894786 RepID=A0AAE8YNY0_9CAUD|nr:hypothetical protein PQE74_gp083 [Bacillus phage vB_BanS_Chewbecca]UGO46166.1 hypothetical protein CHEWBECCA_83 [Bacillus phage vB_BanS_Chewbecca]